jgi:ABC-type Na+ efflux pump permease subunit
MAGAGRKTFTSGSVLSAADVQNYLQDQSVMVFATTTARTSAIASPTEGMVTYIQTNDQMQIYNGSYWIPQAYGQAAGTANATTGALSADATAGGITITFPLYMIFKFF